MQSTIIARYKMTPDNTIYKDTVPWPLITCTHSMDIWCSLILNLIPTTWCKLMVLIELILLDFAMTMMQCWLLVYTSGCLCWHLNVKCSWCYVTLQLQELGDVFTYIINENQQDLISRGKVQCFSIQKCSKFYCKVQWRVILYDVTYSMSLRYSICDCCLLVFQSEEFRN